VLGGIIGAAIGGLAGAQGNNSNQSSTSTVKVAPAGKEELAATKDISKQFGDLQGLVGVGPGQADVKNAYGAQKDLASLLQSYSQGGYLPTSGDFQTATGFARDAFAPQQTALNQQFQQQGVDAARLAAQLGRPVNDPILRAKLAQQQVSAQQNLASQQTAMSSQMAQNMPMQRLGFAQDFTNLQSNLATQAMSNRQALLSVGQSIQNSERQFRLGTATRTNETQQSGGGGLQGFISGAMTGAGVGMGFSNFFNNGSGAGVQAPIPMAGQSNLATGRIA
jgi:hypothetical protein